MVIPVSKPALLGNERKYVDDCLESCWISSNGKYIHLFEEKFASYLGVGHAVACCNGTAALHLALLALGIGEGDEVIVPTLTYVATANAVAYTGAMPILADCDGETWNIDPLKAEALITDKTKAIIAVPLYGHPCDMDLIMDMAHRHSLFVVEDAAEALGARYKGRLCGSIADISTFSFYGNKTITTGEGGMVVTNDCNLAERVKIFKGQGMDPNKRYWFPQIGYNYRMTNIQAAIGLAQMENIDQFLEKRQEISGWYNDSLIDISGITLPVVKEYAEHSWWMYSILIENDNLMHRDDIIKLLERNGIETRPFFYPMHILPSYKNNGTVLTTSEIVSSIGINLPTYYDLKKTDIDYISNTIYEVMRVRGK